MTARIVVYGVGNRKGYGLFKDGAMVDLSSRHCAGWPTQRQGRRILQSSCDAVSGPGSHRQPFATNGDFDPRPAEKRRGHPDPGLARRCDSGVENLVVWASSTALLAPLVEAHSGSVESEPRRGQCDIAC